MNTRNVRLETEEISCTIIRSRRKNDTGMSDTPIRRLQMGSRVFTDSHATTRFSVPKVIALPHQKNPGDSFEIEKQETKEGNS